MKKSMSTLVVILLAVLAGCDHVEFPNQGNITEPPDTTNHAPVQKVMLEEFTGQGCGNCPGAAVTARQLKNIYNDRLILVSIHAGWFANGGNPWVPGDLSCAEGEEIDQSFGISAVGNPNGMVNRKAANGSVVLGPDAWGTQVADILDHTAVSADIEISADYTGETGQITADITVSYLQDLSGDYKIVAAILEDDIVAPQTNYDGNGDPDYNSPTENNYPHQHILRGHMNSTWGSDLAPGSVASGTTTQVSYSMAKGETWDPSNLSVLVYIYEVSTQEILQVESVHID